MRTGNRCGGEAGAEEALAPFGGAPVKRAKQVSQLETAALLLAKRRGAASRPLSRLSERLN
jgi:hypothetical protein